MQTLEKLSNRLFYMTPYQKTDRPILAAIIGNKETLFIDAGNSSEHAKLFKEQLAQQNVFGTFVVLTHWHWDHVFGLEEMNMFTIANYITNRKIKDLQSYSWEDKELDERVEKGIEIPFCRDAIKLELGTKRNIQIPNPTIIFEYKMRLDLGGVTAIIDWVGGDHSMDSNIIYIPEEKTLFLGDCLYANMYAEKWHYTDEKINIVLRAIESHDADYFFLSHHPAPMTKEEFSTFSTLLKTCSKLTVKHKGEQVAIESELSFLLDRELTDDDLEIVGYFVNGYE